MNTGPRNMMSFTVLSLLVATAAAQVSSDLIVYPDLLVHNGKIVTVDDRTFSTNPGTIVEAMAVRDGKILALGSDSQLLSFKGPQTKVINLQGRTVLPGIIDTHSHLQSYAMNHFGWREVARAVIKVPGSAEESWADIKRKALNRIQEETSGRDPGAWIALSFPRTATWKDGTRMAAQQAAGRGLISKAELDAIAPAHPVYIGSGTSAVTNSLAQKKIREIWYGPEEPELLRENGISSNTINRIMPTYFFVPKLDDLAEIYRQENLEWAGFGVTTWASSMRSIRVVSAYQLLDSRKQLGIRVAYAPASGTPLQVIPQMTGVADYGSDYLWSIGTSRRGTDDSYPGLWTSLEPPEISQKIKDRELVVMSPERRASYSKFIEDSIAAGQRFANTHTAGDGSLDLTLDAIEKGSERAGLSLEEIRAKRHVIDHCTMNPRPDQIPRLKKLGIIMSCSPKYISATSERVLADYGEQYVNWIAPVRSLIDAGVKPVLEIDDHKISEFGTIFHYIGLLVNRNVQGRIFGGRERIDRVQALKMSTVWASEYVLREDVLGSLEKGKFADFIVLDQDYLTVPSDQIGTTKVLLTVVGGNLVHQHEDMGI